VKMANVELAKPAKAKTAWPSRGVAQRVRGLAGNHVRRSIVTPTRAGIIPGTHYRARTIVKDSEQAPVEDRSASSESENTQSQEEENTQPLEESDTQPSLIQLSSKKSGLRHHRSKSARLSVGGSSSKPSSWAALQDMPKKHGAFISGPPVGKSLADVAAGGGAGAAGYTDWPSGYKAPAFEFNATQTGTDWFARPTLKTAAAEGTSKSLFTSAGKHKTSDQEGGKDVYWNFSAAISTLVETGEQEHCDDFAEAYKISLKEAEGVISTNLVGKAFGPKPTKAEAEGLVLAEITSKLTHAGLGNDQTKWAGKYSTLFYKSLERDKDPPGWHSIVKGARSVDASGNVVYEIEKGSSQIGTGTHLPPSIIKY
jgi:hypothetical protein